MATAGGVFNGIAGLVGLGGFWDPIKQSNLNNANKCLELTSHLSKLITNELNSLGSGVPADNIN